MLFFFDESSAFAVPSRGDEQHSAAVVVGIAVPDLVAPFLEHDFRDFASTLERDELVNGEPKGARLCYFHRVVFGNLLKKYATRISVTPVTLDLSYLPGSYRGDKFAGRMRAELQDWSERMIYEGPRERIHLLAQQFQNLSASQALRIFTLANCFREALHHAILFLAYGEYESSWETLSFEIDRVHTKPNNREEQVFSIMLLSWLAGWSYGNPIRFLKEVHTPQHVINRKYRRDGGIELGSMIRGNLKWRDSAASWGIQLADISAAVIHAAVRNPNSRREVRPFLRLMRASFYSSERGPGLFAPEPSASEPPNDNLIVERYRPLCKAMSRDREKFRNVRLPWETA
jgi:hypothetical protein